MSLSDIVSSLGLDGWAIGALLLFLGAFIAVVWRAVRHYPRPVADAAASIVFDESDRSAQEGEA